MSGVRITFTGMSGSGQMQYGFSVQSTQGGLPPHPPQTINLSPSDQVFVDLAQLVSDPNVDTPRVVDAGQTLHTMLHTHQNTAVALPSALNAPANAPDRDIWLCFPPYDDAMRHLPWETLHDPSQGFIDNDLGLPVVRMVDTKQDATQPPTALPADGLRIISVIAADGLKTEGGREFKALYDALAAYIKPWTLHVYSSDQPVIDQITAIGNPRVQHHFVPATATDLMTRISNFKPQICHMFCHGVSVGQGAARLELSTRGSQTNRATVEVKASHLTAALPSSAWLVMLSACNSGAAPGDSGSLATALVEDGVPIVVGMHEPTQVRTLHAFIKGFLAPVLTSLDQALAQNGRVPLSVASCLPAARQAICATFRKPNGNPAERMKGWSLPAMFVSSNPFHIEPGTDDDDDDDDDDTLAVLASLNRNRDMLQSFLDRMGGQISAEDATEIKARIATIDREILESLR
ncbi:CHAT domain-containing protein [Rhodobacteraceae bacterium B1Z28]|uniref:CHAT domain-containing protein n=1 Tax=Ruegeria haliotis TaxID=2747601 RepID=A0ABX2PV54_9RHOB|nr:CHAT domain-containing protein [Ruegeria haliotis]NVO58047.1 CHAT domain-containing protein [Ruegeria haliotis]